MSGKAFIRWAVGLAGAGAVVMGSIAPAMARGHGHYRGYGYGYGAPYRYGYGYGHRHYRYPYRHYRRGIDAGDLIGIAAVIGAVAVIANSAKKDRDSRDHDRDGRYRGNDDYRDRRDDDRRDDRDWSDGREMTFDENDEGGYGSDWSSDGA